MFLLRLLILLLAPLAMAAAASAAPLVELLAFRVTTTVDAAGTHESLEPLGALRPGDVVEYQARCRHAGTGPVRDLHVTVPVPAGGLEFVAPQGQPPAEASTDGLRFAPFPLTRSVRRPDGRSATEPVPLAAYRALRWQVAELKTGETRVFRARMVLPTDAPVAAVADATTAPPVRSTR